MVVSWISEALSDMIEANEPYDMLMLSGHDDFGCCCWVVWFFWGMAENAIAIPLYFIRSHTQIMIGWGCEIVLCF